VKCDVRHFAVSLLAASCTTLHLSAVQSPATSQAQRHETQRAVVLELTIKETGGQLRKPQLTVGVGATGIAEFDGVGRLGLRPTAVSKAGEVIVVVFDASATPMKELEQLPAARQR
jgi:hypothetical protein